MDINLFLKSIRAEVKEIVGPHIAFETTLNKDSLDIMVHGVIGDDFDGLDSNSIVGEINDYTGDAIRLDISTPGGSVLDALAVYSALDSHPAHVTANITGGAYSAGTIIASGADVIRIGEAANFMVHKAWSYAVGDADIMLEAARDLQRADRQIAMLLAARSGNSVDDVRDYMEGGAGNAGTTFTGAEAVENGFADEVISLKKKPKMNQMPQPQIDTSRLAALKAYLTTCKR